MMWNSSDMYASIVGGILAGLALVLVELIWRLFYGLFQKHRALRAIKKFFREWEESIKNIGGIDDAAAGVSVSKEVTQFLQHKYYLRIVPIPLSRWGKHIPEQQNDDIIQVIATHEHAEVGIIPKGNVPSQNFYDSFFGRVREIKGLKW